MKEFTKTVNAPVPPERRAALIEWIEKQGVENAAEYVDSHINKNEECYINNLYKVDVGTSPDGKICHLSIRRLDREAIHDWRHLQQIKNMIIGAEYEAVEIYPAEERLVDTANQYHLWVFMDKAYRLPFGFMQRCVDYECAPGTNAKQRPL